MKKFDTIITIVFLVVLALLFFIENGKNIFAIFLIPYSMYWFFGGIPLLLNKGYGKAFKEAEQNKRSVKYLIFSAGCGIIISFGLVGISFKLLQWPGHQPTTYSMLVLQIIIVALSLIFYTKTKNPIFKRTILRMGISILFLSYFLFLYQL